MSVDIIALLAAVWAAIWTFPGVQAIISLTLLNLVLALAVAFKYQKFTFADLSAFLFTQLIPYTITYAAFALLSKGTGFEWVSSVVLLLIITTLGAKIAANLALLGILVPKAVLPIVQPRPPKVVVVGTQKPDEGVSDN